MEFLNQDEVPLVPASGYYSFWRKFNDITRDRFVSLRYVKKVSRFLQNQIKALQNLEKIMIQLQNALFQRAFKGQVDYAEARKVLKKVDRIYFKLQMRFRNFEKRYKAFEARVLKETDEWMLKCPLERFPFSKFANVSEEAKRSAKQEWENGKGWGKEILREARTFRMEWKQLDSQWNVGTSRSFTLIIPLMLASSNST